MCDGNELRVVTDRYLDEALVQRQVVSDGVLPTLLVLSVVREPIQTYSNTITSLPISGDGLPATGVFHFRDLRMTS